MKKKIIVSIVIILFILFILGLVTSYKDNARVRNGMEPKYTIKIISDNGSKVTYIGLGYKVIRYVGVSPNEPFDKGLGFKYGSWFMKYELENNGEPPSSIEEISSEISIYLENRINNDLNYSYNYVDQEKNVVVVGLMDNSEEKQDEFLKGVFLEKYGLEYINYIKLNKLIEFVKTKEIFKAKVLNFNKEKDNGSILVEVLDDSKSFKKGEKVFVNILNHNKNVTYDKDMVVNIAFNGMINESYPPQISTAEVYIDLNK